MALEETLHRPKELDKVVNTKTAENTGERWNTWPDLTYTASMAVAKGIIHGYNTAMMLNMNGHVLRRYILRCAGVLAICYQ